MYPPPQHPQQPYYQPPPQPPPKSGGIGKTLVSITAILAGVCVVAMIVAPKAERPASATPTPTVAPAPTPPTPAPTNAAPAAPAAPAEPVPAPAVPAAAPTAAPAPAATGESVEDAVPRGTPVVVAGLEATVLDARFTRRVSHGFFRHTAPEGSTLLVMRYRVRNTTREPIQALSFADEVIAGGTTYRPSSQCDMAVNALGISDTLNPNLPRTFEACFEVPPDTHGFVVKFNRTLTDRFAQTGL